MSDIHVCWPGEWIKEAEVIEQKHVRRKMLKKSIVWLNTTAAYTPMRVRR